MHGFIFIEFEKFVMTHLDYATWLEAQEENGLVGREYSPTALYPDQELKGLLNSISAMKNLEVGALLEQFGYYIVPDLLKVYRAYIKPEWRTLDVLEHAEKTIHVAVRRSTNGAAPPILDIHRPLPNEVVIRYVSNRNMPELGVGIIKGIAQYFGEAENIQIKLQKNDANGHSTFFVRDQSA